MQPKSEKLDENALQNRQILTICLIVGVFSVYYFSNPKLQSHYDYTFRVAENFLRGALVLAKNRRLG